MWYGRTCSPGQIVPELPLQLQVALEQPDLVGQSLAEPLEVEEEALSVAMELSHLPVHLGGVVWGVECEKDFNIRHRG